jgi:hypothetical protein
MAFDPKSMPPAIIVDIDGTLADCGHRRHYVLEKPKNWASFFAAMDMDRPNGWCDRLIRMAAFGNGDFNCKILLVSGRGEEYRHVTLEWLKRWDIHWDILFMRPAKDNRKDTEVKREIYDKKIAPHFDVQFVVDDRKCVVEMWRSLGLPTLQCAEGDF